MPPTDPPLLHSGQPVRIQSGAAGAVAAHVVETATPPELPDLRGAPPARLVREILAEWDVRQIAMLGYTNAAGQPVAFLALATSHGWRDLRGRRLTITPRETDS